jgi:hypothetical protein
MKKRSSFMTAFVTGFAGFVLVATQAAAQVLFSAGTYTQDFNSLPNAATVTSNQWVNGVTLSGWYARAQNSAGGAGAVGDSTGATNITTDTGSSGTGRFYSYGIAGINPVTDRALGSVCSGTSGSIAYGLRFTNDTGVALTNFNITYTGEQWRNGGNASLAAQPLAFSYRIDSTAIADSDPASALTWTPVTALNFISPTTNNQATALDGNNATNRIALTFKISGVVLIAGQEIFFRWLDLNDAGNDHALAIDDLSISFETNLAAVATAPVITVNPASQTVGAGNGATFNVTATGTQPFTYSWYVTNAGVSELVGTASSFTTNNLPLAASGTKLYVVLTNSVGSATSAVATLTVTNVSAVFTNIAYLHTLQNANFVLTNTTTLFSATGIVTTTDNLTSGATVSFHIQDETGGIDVFHYTANGPFLGGVPNAGDLVRVTAPLAQFNGLTEFAPTNANPTHEITVLSSGNPIPAPAVFDFTTINPAVMESFYEGRLVVVSNVFLAVTNVSGVVIAGQSIYMTNLVGQTFRLINPTPAIEPQGFPVPAFAASVRGVISQSDNAVPLDSGYSMYLLRSSDIEAGTPPTAPTPESLQISVSGGNAVMTWTSPLFNLQASPSVTGTYTNIPGATSPYSYPISGGERYFRLAYP